MDTVSILVPEIDVFLKNSRQRLNYSSEGSARLKKTKASRVPEQTRRYSHGDPTQLIDWKLYARTDQLLIREHKDEASLNISICTYFDESMNWPLNSDITSKWEVAVRIAFHLAYQHLSCGDNVKVFFINGKENFHLRAKSTSFLRKCFSSFEDNFAFENIVETFKEGDLDIDKGCDKAYILGDHINAIDFDLYSEAKDVSFKHILSSLDFDYDWISPSDFYATELSSNKKVKGKALTSSNFLKKEIEKWRSQLVESLSLRQISYQLITDKTTLDSYLNDLSWEMRI